MIRSWVFGLRSLEIALDLLSSRIKTEDRRPKTNTMHELSIAISLVDLAAEHARQHGGVRLNALHLKLGPLSGVVRDALLFSYDVACNGTTLEGSQLVIEDVPVIVHCQHCEAERELESIQHLCCPVCGKLTPEVVQGRELELVAMEIEETGEEAGQLVGVTE